MAVAAKDLHGTLDALILKTLSWGPRHGYAIARWLEDTSRDELVIEEGSLYPALYRMERKGWIKSRWLEAESGRKRKYYALTRRGAQALAEQRSDWIAVNTTLASLWKGHHV